VQEAIAVHPEAALPLKVERDGELLDLTVRPSLDKSTGTGRIGVYFWTNPVVSAVTPGSPAAAAGLEPGDRITAINGEDFLYTVALVRILESRPETLDVEYERGGLPGRTTLTPVYTEAGVEDPGLQWETLTYRTPALNPLAALVKGVRETGETLVVSVRSLGLLFRGVDLTQAVSGPVRITYMVGEAAAEGFGQSLGTGLRSLGDFLALISIALCVMNLLPLPILDGGMILLFVVEGIRRKPLPPRAVMIFQTVGVVLIISLMVFAVFGDILFLARR